MINSSCKVFLIWNHAERNFINFIVRNSLTTKQYTTWVALRNLSVKTTSSSKKLVLCWFSRIISRLKITNHICKSKLTATARFEVFFLLEETTLSWTAKMSGKPRTCFLTLSSVCSIYSISRNTYRWNYLTVIVSRTWFVPCGCSALELG